MVRAHTTTAAEITTTAAEITATAAEITQKALCEFFSMARMNV